MGKKPTFKMIVKGDVYKDKEGKEKAKWVQVGECWEVDNGHGLDCRIANNISVRERVYIRPVDSGKNSTEE